MAALISIIVHASLLLIVTGALAVMLADRVVGANIGAGMAMLTLGGLGLPWSLIDLLGTWPKQGGDRAEIAFFAFCAVLNLVVHAAVRTVRVRRQPESKA